MEKQLNCILKFTLQDFALRRVAESVFNETDILESIEKWQFSSIGIYEDQQCVYRETLEKKIKNKILNLVLPESLRMQMIDLVRPMTLDTLKWKMHHEKMLSARSLSREYFDIHVLKQLRRTATGAIDYGRTAEELVRLEMLDIRKRYKLACSYCLVDYIAVLWDQFPDHQSYFYTNNDTFPIRETRLEFCWPYILKGEESKLDDIIGDSFNQYAFIKTAGQGNIAAAKYFFAKLTQQERDISIFRTLYDIQRCSLNKNMCITQEDFPIETFFDVLRYILSLLSPEEQLRVFKQFHCVVFKIFWEWPWSYLFFDIADVIWTFVPEESYFQVVYYFISNIRLQCPHFYSPSFLQDFFLHSPVNFRKVFAFHHSSLFREIFSAEDTETIKVIFRNLSVENRIKLLCDNEFFEHLNRLIMLDKCHLVELCLREVTMSEKQLKKLEYVYMSLITRTSRYDSDIRFKKHKWSMFFQFLIKTKTSATKRGSKGEIPKGAKKQCKE